MAIPAFPDKHDPNAGKSGTWTFFIDLLDAGVSLLSGTVTVVDADDQPIIGTDLIVSDVSIGQISEQVWGVNFCLTGGTVPPATPGQPRPIAYYILRCRYTKSTSPLTGDDASMRIGVRNN